MTPEQPKPAALPAASKTIRELATELGVDLDATKSDPLLNYVLGTFQRYASFKIQDQAIPNFYDGFLPTQRAYIQSLQDIGALSKGKHVKSTKAVAHVAANYRPVGNTYDVLVNMSQKWKVPLMMTNPEGNWGPVDNGVAAAERYTEVKLSQFCENVVLPDLPKRVDAEKAPHSIVPSSKCEFGHLWEEEYLPVRLPMLLLNGSNGIAVSMAQNYQPLSLHAFLPAFINYVKGKTYSPDHGNQTQFDYSSLYMGYPAQPLIAATQEDVAQVFKNGRGSIRCMGRFHYELKGKPLAYQNPEGHLTDTIVFTSIPPQTVLNSIGDAFNTQRLNNPEFLFSGFKNETDSKNVRLLFKLKTQQKVGTEELESQISMLYKECKLMDTMTVNMTALKDLYPQNYNIGLLLHDWTQERHQILIRVSTEQAERLSKQIERLNLLRMAKHCKAEVMAAVTKLNTETEIHTALDQLFNPLLEQFELIRYTAEDTKEISAMSLRQLSKLEDDAQLRRLQELKARRDGFLVLINSEPARQTHLAEELTQILNQLDDWGIRKFKNEYDPSLLRYVDNKPKVAAVREYVAESISCAQTPNIVMHTKKGMVYVLKNNSVKGAPSNIPLLGDDQIAQAFFSFSEKTPILFADGTVHFIEAPTNQMLTPLKLANLANKKIAGNMDAIDYALPICVDSSCSDSKRSSDFHFVAVCDANLIKRVDAEGISTPRSRLQFKSKPAAIWLMHKTNATLYAEGQALDVSAHSTVSAKATHRLAKAGVFGNVSKINTYNRGYMLAHTQSTVWKEQATAPESPVKPKAKPANTKVAPSSVFANVPAAPAKPKDTAETPRTKSPFL